MAWRAALLLVLLAARGGIVDASRVRVRTSTDDAESSSSSALGSSAQGIDAKTLPKLINAGVGLITSLITAFNEDVPDYEYAFESLNYQGWSLVKLVVPAAEHLSPEMRNAKAAWDHAFSDLPALTAAMLQAHAKGDSRAGIEGLFNIVDLGLSTAAKAAPTDAKYLLAVAELAKRLGSACTQFSAEMGFLEGSQSLVQVASSADAGIEPGKLNSLISTGVGLITTFISACTEDPPDFEYAINSFSIQGWKMAKLVVPAKDHRSKGMRKAKTAWNKVFADAPEIADRAYAAYKEGDVELTIRTVLATLDIGLRTCSEISDSGGGRFSAVADLIEGVSGGMLSFASEIGWLPPAE